MKTNKDLTHNDRQRRYRKSHKTISLSFSQEKTYQLHEAAEKTGKTPSELLKSLLDSHLTETSELVLPRESKLQDLILALRRIGTNINQLIRYVHTTNSISHSDIKILLRCMATIESEVKSALATPPAITDLLAEYLTEHPKALPRLLQFLNDYAHDYQSNIGQK